VPSANTSVSDTWSSTRSFPQSSCP
jgi:hypothetical protein